MAIDWQKLQQYSLFGGLEEAAINYLLGFLQEVSFEAGQVIFENGQHGDELCFILSGSVDVKAEGVFLCNLHAGQQFGEMHLIDIMTRSADVIGHDPGTLLLITNKDLMKLRQFNSDAFVLMVMNCSRDISRRLRIMNDKYVALEHQRQDHEPQ
ncbi:MAG: cyclic nucleotide-binding domain-containing protein [Planctomycetes bacterium]|nr:cyclic nucleotide-binding domain-containing protein [Planctomycetota bacterium]